MPVSRRTPDAHRNAGHVERDGTVVLAFSVSAVLRATLLAALIWAPEHLKPALPRHLTLRVKRTSQKLNPAFRASLPNLGWIRFREHRPLQGNIRTVFRCVRCGLQLNADYTALSKSAF